MNSNDCFLCQSSPKTNSLTSMINQALYDRYATAYNQRYLDQIDDIVEEQYTQDAALFRESCFQDDQQEWLSRLYRAEEWNRKIKNLGVYWSCHTDIPRFFGLPIELAFYKHYDKKRDFEEKQWRLKMGEQIDSSSSMRDNTGQITHQTNKSNLHNVLKDLSRISKRVLDESRAFNDICGKLSDLVKIKGKRIKKINMMPDYLRESTDRDNFSLFIKNQRKGKGRRLPRKNMISYDRPPAVHLYPFRKPHKLKNSSSQIGHKGSMQSTMSKKNNIQNAVFCGEVKGMKTQTFKPTLRSTQSVNRLRFRNFSKKQSIGQIYGTITNKTKSFSNNIISSGNLGRTSIVNFKKRINNNRSQSVVRTIQEKERPQSVTLKGRSKSINIIKYIPNADKKSTIESRRYSPGKMTKRQSSNSLTTGVFKRRPSGSKGKIPTQTSLKKIIPLESQEEAKQKVDKLLNQKLFVNANPSSLYQKLKKIAL